MTRRPSNKTQIAYDQEHDEWRRLVGTVLLSFGDIELLTVKCLAHLPSDKISDTASRLPLGKRIDLLVEIIEGRYGTADADGGEFAQHPQSVFQLARAPLILELIGRVGKRDLRLLRHAT